MSQEIIGFGWFDSSFEMHLSTFKKVHANKSIQNNTHHIAINIYLYSINHLSTKK